MTTTLQPQLDSYPDRGPTLGRNDPLLQELWETKAALNAAAAYSVARLAEQAERFDLDATIARLRQQARH
jgi:hypothetical protein